MNRRDAIKVIGGGAALMGLGAISAARADAPAAAPAAPAQRPLTEQPFVLPKLGYSFDALEPHFDAQTMEIHYSKHHAAYIKNANKALEGHPELAAKSGEEILGSLASIPEPLRTTLRNNIGGHINHCFWWAGLSPKGGGTPTGALAGRITKEFGSYDEMKARFTEAAMKRFGSGWAWLVLKANRLGISSTANQDSPVSSGALPLIGIDVWEHAYYLKYQNRRADYVAAYLEVVDWNQAGKVFDAEQTVTPDS